MKKLLAVLLLLPILFSTAYADELLLGSRGDDVLEVQQRLIELGYLAGTADGQYGDMTAIAVMQFQKVNGLKQTGVTNDATRKLLFSDNVQADETVLAQSRLITLGYLTGTPDGIWGEKSAAALKHFQRVNGLEQTGELDEATTAALHSEMALRDEVLDAQNRLIALGYYAGDADGAMNDDMRNAIVSFQRLNGLEQTGELDDATLEMLSAEQQKYELLSQGSEGEAVIALQQRLIALGFLEDGADGQYGQKTVAAVTKFRQHLIDQGVPGITAGGSATPVMQEYLFSEHYSSYIKDIRPGDVDGEVQRIERRLALLGYMDAAADDTFDEYAADALSVFQATENLTETGYADQATTDRLFSGEAQQADAFVPHDIALGDSGEAVRQLQQSLIRCGMFAGIADGKYSDELESAVVRMYEYLSGAEDPRAELFAQRELVSMDAQKALQNGDVSVYADISAGNAEDVKRIQRRLHTLHYISSRLIDGDYGKGTRAAITAFQTNNGLEATGEADEATQRLLFSDDAVYHQTPYMLEIVIAEQRVYVYQLSDAGEYEQIAEYICSTGIGNTTPTGIFVDTQPLNRWHYFKKFDCWAQYSYQIDGDILFHSVLYDDNDTRTLRYNSVYALGQKASHGCIRLNPEDARWIYENCESGTIVEIR